MFGKHYVPVKRKLFVVAEKNGCCEVVRWLDKKMDGTFELNVSPVLEKGYQGKNWDEYADLAEECEKAFPMISFYVTSERYLPEMHRLQKITGVVSRPL